MAKIKIKAKRDFYIDCSPNGARYFINGTLVSREAYEREYEKDNPRPIARTTTRMKPKAKPEQWTRLFLVDRFGYTTGGYIAPAPMMMELSHMAHEKMKRLHRKCANEEQMLETINQFDAFQRVADFNDYYIRAQQILDKWKVLLGIPSAA